MPFAGSAVFQSFHASPSACQKKLKKLTSNFKISLLRYPLSVASHKVFFKASEYRNILIFFWPVVFHGILAAFYCNHFILLNEAISVLLMESISVKQIGHAEKLLWNFTSQTGHLYGEPYQTANVHLLVHLADSVRALGPLWTHSCFYFEDKNSYLLRLIHGNIPMQVVHAVKLVQSIPAISQTIKPANAITDFYTRMTNDHSFCQENKDEHNWSIKWTSTGGNSPLCNGKTCRPLHSLYKHLAQVKRNGLTTRHYGKGKRRNNFPVVFCHETQIRYGQSSSLPLRNLVPNVHLLIHLKVKVFYATRHCNNTTCAPIGNVCQHSCSCPWTCTGQSYFPWLNIYAWQCVCSSFPKHAREVLGMYSMILNLSKGRIPHTTQ